MSEEGRFWQRDDSKRGSLSMVDNPKNKKAIHQFSWFAPFFLYRLQVAEPIWSARAHNGPAYDIKFYENADNPLLLSCGDDGKIFGWKRSDIAMSEFTVGSQGLDLYPVLELLNPQHKGPWGALSPIPENNALVVDNEAGSVYSAAGDSCAYCWDLETSKIKTIFKGHTDYVQSVVTRKSYNQVLLLAILCPVVLNNRFGQPS